MKLDFGVSLSSSDTYKLDYRPTVKAKLRMSDNESRDLAISIKISLGE